MNDRGILWLKLDTQSRARLSAAYPAKYHDTYYDHVTLLFGVLRKDVEEYIGQEAQTSGYAYVDNGYIEALRVDSGDLPDTYGVPHITLSAESGTDPFESVAMLINDHSETPRDAPLVITGTIQFISL